MMGSGYGGRPSGGVLGAGLRMPLLPPLPAFWHVAEEQAGGGFLFAGLVLDQRLTGAGGVTLLRGVWGQGAWPQVGSGGRLPVRVLFLRNREEGYAQAVGQGLVFWRQ